MIIRCIIQARMGSERLPGKVLLPLLGRPMLSHVVSRVRLSHLVDEVVIATSNSERDDIIADLCRSEGWDCYRGSEEDVLDRYYHAANGAEHLIRVTGDCPVIDSNVIDYVIAAYQCASPRVDYASNTLERTYPRGLDIEVFSFAALERAWKEDRSATGREHVTPYFYLHPERFRLLSVSNSIDYSGYRLTVDTIQDYRLIEQIYVHFGHSEFDWQSIIDLLKAKPNLAISNQGIPQKQIFG